MHFILLFHVAFYISWCMGGKFKSSRLVDRDPTRIQKKYIENTSWKVWAYGIYARVVDVSEIERVSAVNE